MKLFALLCKELESTFLLSEKLRNWKNGLLLAGPGVDKNAGNSNEVSPERMTEGAPAENPARLDS